jgi:hypothetical protein
MMLEYEQRKLLDRAIAQARFYERQRFAAEAEQLRAEMKAERDALFANIVAECEALRCRLETVQNEFLNFRAGVTKDKQLLEHINRERMLVAAQTAQREWDTTLH